MRTLVFLLHLSEKRLKIDMNFYLTTLIMAISMFHGLAQTTTRPKETNIMFFPFGSYGKILKSLFGSIAYSTFLSILENTKIGKTKLYFVPRIVKTQWIHARSVCRAYGLEFASLSTPEEADAFLKYAEENYELLDLYVLLGAYTAVASSTEDYYWVNSGKHLNYPLRFPPGEPNFLGQREFCLSLMKNATNQFNFNDLDCSENAYKFICQMYI